MNTNGQEKQDPKKFHIQNALTGAVYGLLLGTAFTLVAAFIDKWLYPQLPFGVDWTQAASRWTSIGLGLALIGGITCLFTESFHGLVAGTVTASVLALTFSLFFSPTSTGAKVIVLLFTLAPVAVMSLPIAWTIRRLTQNHLHALHMKWSALRILGLVLITIVLGAGAGYFMKISEDGLMAVQMVHENLQAAPADQKKEVSEVEGLQDHAGMKYSLSQKTSAMTTTGFDVRAKYDDGYTVECVVVVYPGTNPYIKLCQQIQ